MRKQQQALPSSSAKQRPAPLVYGTVVIGILALFGLFFSSRTGGLFQLVTATVVPAQVQETTILPPPLSTITITDTTLPEPPMLVAVLPSATSTDIALSTPTPDPAPSATMTIPLSITEFPLADANETGNATAPAREPWPTTDPALLRRPPVDLNSSPAHLWFGRPVDGNNVPSAPYRFGMTFEQQLSPHRGVDIANSLGTPIVAVGPGTVFFAGEDAETMFGPRTDFYGRVVVVKMDWQWEGHTIYTLYGHLESIAVTAGQAVISGDVMGTIGSSGVAPASHLHFEVRQDLPYDYSSVRNPEIWYWPFAGRGVLAGRVIDANGFFMPGMRVNLDCNDVSPRYVETYWDQYTLPDDVLVENFAISDLPAGGCRVWIDLSGEVVEKWVEMYPGELSTVTLQARP